MFPLKVKQACIFWRVTTLFISLKTWIQRTLELGSDPVTLTTEDFVQTTKTSSQEFPLSALHLLLSQRQDILDNHSMKENQGGMNQVPVEAASGECAQEVNTSRYRAPAFEELEFHWNDCDLKKDTVSRPSIKSQFSPAAFGDCEMGSLVRDENVIDVEEKQGKLTSPPLPPLPPPPPSPNPSISCFSKQHTKYNFWRFHAIKWIKTKFVGGEFFLKSKIFKKIFHFKSWRHVKMLNLFFRLLLKDPFPAVILVPYKTNNQMWNRPFLSDCVACFCLMMSCFFCLIVNCQLRVIWILGGNNSIRFCTTS